MTYLVSLLKYARSRHLQILKLLNNTIWPKVKNIVAHTLAASETLGMQTGSGENNPAKTNHILWVFRNLSNEIVFKGSLSWRARAIFQAEWFLGEGIMLMFPETSVLPPRPRKYKCRWTRRDPQGDFCHWGWEQMVVLGSRESLNPWNSLPCLEGCSRLIGSFQPVKPRGQRGYSWEVTSRNYSFLLSESLALSPGQCLRGKDDFGSFCFAILICSAETAWLIINSTMKT